MPRTPEQLKKLAQDLVAGHICTSDYVHRRDPSMVPMVFLPLAMMSEEDVQKLRDEKVTLLFEYYEKALPRSVNGLPMFMSMRTMNEEEHKQLYDLARRMQAALDGVEVEDGGSREKEPP